MKGLDGRMKETEEGIGVLWKERSVYVCMAIIRKEESVIARDYAYLPVI